MISLATSSAVHVVWMETFPINPISASFVLFAPRGIGKSLTFSDGKRHTTSFVSVFPVFGLHVADRFRFLGPLTIPFPPKSDGSAIAC